MPSVKPVREPDAGNPQVRFEERRRETERWPRLRHRHPGESRREQRLPRPNATAPAVDSTRTCCTSRLLLGGRLLLLGVRRRLLPARPARLDAEAEERLIVEAEAAPEQR